MDIMLEEVGDKFQQW